MIRYRSFRNTDPPAIAALWQSQPKIRGRNPGVTSTLLEQLVFSKPYFDPSGVIIAERDDGAIVGFVHAGFGPTDDMDSLSYELGVTCVLMVTAGETSVPDELVSRSEQYLYRHGAKVLYGGGVYPLNPFYLGLYGGSELSGVPADDIAFRESLHRAGYQSISRNRVYERQLTGFHRSIDRTQLIIGRRFILHKSKGCRTSNWWNVAQWGMLETMMFQLCERDSGKVRGSTMAWRMNGNGPHDAPAYGLASLEIDEQFRRQGLGKYLVSEVCKSIINDGAESLEAQVMTDNGAAIGLYETLGFKKVGTADVFRKNG